MSDLEKFEHDSYIKGNNFWPFFGGWMQQTPQAILSLNRLINVYNFRTIIELGTHTAGLSCLFALYSYGSKELAIAENHPEPSLSLQNNSFCKQETEFHTFDIYQRDLPKIELLKKLGSHFHKKDCLNDDETISFIRKLISSSGRTLLLCDNGDKVKEFHLYAPYLKDGDFIMVHDWAYDEERFQQIKEQKIWYAHESKWSDIEECCRENNIIPVFQDEFDKSVWFCGIKK